MTERRRKSHGQSSESHGNEGSASNVRDLAREAAAKRSSKGNAAGSSSKFWWAVSIAAFLVASGLAYTYWRGVLMSTEGPTHITPLPLPRVSDLQQFKGEHRERLFWGTYRPHLYLGIRSRTPRSLLAGLMWLGVRDGHYTIRHTCEQGDQLSRYGWLQHDGSTYGRQELLDQGMLLSTSFMKSNEQGSGYGGDWAVRIRVEEDTTSSSDTGGSQRLGMVNSAFFYVADELGRLLNLWPKGVDVEDAPFAEGFADEIGKWQLYAQRKGDVKMNFVGIQHLQMETLTKPVGNILQSQARSAGVLQLPDAVGKDSNVAIIQLTGLLPFELDVVFVSGVNANAARVKERVENLSGTHLGKRLADKEQEFEDRFQATFRLNEKVKSKSEQEVGRAALSNLLGGVGYFYGQSRVEIPAEYKVSSSQDSSFWDYWPAELYSAVPSRSFFPRGFLWDEGFHQLLVSRWDRNISFDIIGHWLDLMNVDGWIPREQILGAEAKSKVPEEFITQYTTNANPPTLFLALNRLASKFLSDQDKGGGTSEDLLYFKSIFPRLAVWFNWFNTTQIGKEQGTYYWHGRDPYSKTELNAKTLTSGFDDYPRASHPSDDERHVDLWCWMALAAKTMSLVAGIAGEPHEAYAATARTLTNLTRLNEMHFDFESGRYYDYGNHTEKVKLKWQEIRDTDTGFTRKILRRAVSEQPELGWVPHFGYVSLLPLAMRIIPHDSPILGHHLAMLQNHRLLWSNYGLRSLSSDSTIYMKKNTEHDAPYWRGPIWINMNSYMVSTIYMKKNTEHDAPYWRGPIWINMNYLVLSALHNYATVEGPYKTAANATYTQLREALIRNVVEKYQASGYLWENYNAVGSNKGKGQGSHPFTGWTSLILLIMAEIY